MRSLAQPCAVNITLSSLWKAKNGVFSLRIAAYPEAKKGDVHCARLRKAANWPNNNANPSGLSEKKVYCVEKRDMCDP